MAIQLGSGRSFTSDSHRNEVQYYPNSPWYDEYQQMTYWDWDRTFDDYAGVVLCHSSYSSHYWGQGAFCGVGQSDITLTGVPVPWNPSVTVNLIVKPANYFACTGDSGGTVWREQANGDFLINGIIQGGSPNQNKLVEGYSMSCGYSSWATHVRSAFEVGLTRPWGMG